MPNPVLTSYAPVCEPEVVRNIVSRKEYTFPDCVKLVVGALRSGFAVVGDDMRMLRKRFRGDHVADKFFWDLEDHHRNLLDVDQIEGKWRDIIAKSTLV